MRRVSIYSFKVPNSFSCIWKMVSQKSSAILSIEYCSEAPFIARKGTQVANFNCKKITWLGWNPICVSDLDWSTKIVYLSQISKSHN